MCSTLSMRLSAVNHQLNGTSKVFAMQTATPGTRRSVLQKVCFSSARSLDRCISALLVRCQSMNRTILQPSGSAYAM